MFRSLLTFLSLTLLLGSSFASERLGTHGAKLNLGNGWKRRVINADLSDDQWANGELYLIVLEQERLFVGEADARETVEESVSNLALKKLTEPEWERVRRRDGLFQAHQVFDASFSGIRLRYHVLSSGRDGLGYLFLLWSSFSEAKSVDREAERILRGLRMPGKSTAWGRSCVPRERRIHMGGAAVVFQTQDSVLVEDEDPGDANIFLSSADDKMIWSLLEIETTSLTAAADETWETFRDSVDEIEMTSREPFDVQGREGVLSTYFAEAEGGWTFESLVVELPDGTYLDARFLTNAAQGTYPRMRSMLFDSLRIEESAEVDAYPEVDPPDARPEVSDNQRRLLDASDVVGLLERDFGDVERTADGWVVAHNNGLDLIDPTSGTVKSVFSEDGYYNERSVADVAGELWMCGAEGLATVEKGLARSIDVEASRVAPGGDGRLLLIRKVPAVDVVGFTSNGIQVGPDRLIERAADGGERVVLELPERAMQRLSLDGRGEHVLLGVTPGRVAWGGELTLVRVDLASGVATDLTGAWTSVRGIEPAVEGWLVVGQPTDGAPGVYRIDSEGEPELLVTGEPMRALGFAEDDRLVFATRWGEDSDQLGVRTIPLADARELGPPCAPLHASLLQQVSRLVLAEGGGEMFDPQPFKNFADLEALLEAADSELLAATGARLPIDRGPVDELINACAGSDSMGHEGLLLLTAVLSRCLVEEGAEWVEGSEPLLGSFGFGGGSSHENDFALSYHPAEVVVLIGMPDTEWWSGATTILDHAQGRRLLIGMDGGALEREVDALDEPGWASLADSGDVNGLAALIDRHASNDHLRDRVYERLAATGRLEDVRALAEPRATGEEPHITDVTAWFGSRVALEQEGAATGSTVADLRAAIRVHPAAGELYVLLGQIYERQADGDELARACYRKALDVLYWGPSYTAATEALVRLDG
jgi:hypothetical protein